MTPLKAPRFERLPNFRCPFGRSTARAGTRSHTSSILATKFYCDGASEECVVDVSSSPRGSEVIQWMSHLLSRRSLTMNFHSVSSLRRQCRPAKRQLGWPRPHAEDPSSRSADARADHPGSSVSRAPTSPAISTSTASSMRYSTSRCRHCAAC